MAVRLAGVIIPNNKRVEVALTYVYGIGISTARKLLTSTNINPDTRVKDLTEIEINSLRPIIEKQLKVEGELRRDTMLNIKRLKEINSYRGSRHNKRLPVHGQRTKTNSRTVRGNVRRTMGSGRRSLEKT